MRASLRVLALSVSILLALAGCRLTVPSGDGATASIPAGNAELMAYIAEQPLVSAEAGYRAAYLLHSGEAFAGDFEALRARLAEDDLIPLRWSHAPDEALTRAAVGTLIYRACELKSGVNAQLTGLGRYAWRELQYRRIAEPASEYNLISGGEFVGLLLRADEFRGGRRDDPSGPTLELGDRPG